MTFSTSDRAIRTSDGVIEFIDATGERIGRYSLESGDLTIAGTIRADDDSL